MELNLKGSHRQTYESVFQHPIARNLAWREVRSMLGALDGLEQEEHDGTLRVKRNGRTLVLHRPYLKNIADVGELMQIRHFLEHSGTTLVQPPEKGAHILVVIDHREARIFAAQTQGCVPQRIVPHDPHGSGRHLHYVEVDSNGQRKQERKGFYQAVAKAMHGARQILVFGSGTGASSAMEHLLTDLKTNHNYLAERVVGAIVVNEQHLTEDQLLAKAREFYSKVAL